MKSYVDGRRPSHEPLPVESAAPSASMNTPPSSWRRTGALVFLRRAVEEWVATDEGDEFRLIVGVIGHGYLRAVVAA